MEEIEVSPAKLRSISSHSRMSYGKRKPKQVFTKSGGKDTKIQHQVAEVMNISAEEFSMKVDVPENLKEMKEKARDLDKLTYLIKEQFSKCSGDKKNSY